MILAEKIMKLRKQRGWSQEELALRIGVSRQSVSKWESMSSFPDLDKIIKLSELFGVSTDYLLKDDVEEEPGFELEASNDAKSKDYDLVNTKVEVTLEEANQYMELVEKSAKKIAGGVAACILSPVFLIILSGFAEEGVISVSENMASAIGAAILLIMIVCAVAIFISTGIQLNKYEYLEEELLDLQYGIAGIVETKKEKHESVFKLQITTGVALCILSVVPIVVASGFNASEQVYISLVALLLIFIAAAVFLFVNAGMLHSCYQILLEEGDYTVEKKINSKRNKNISTAYWCSVTAVFLGYSFVTGNWGISWIIWPVAGVLFGAVIALANGVRKNK